MSEFDVLCIGNAIVDIIARAEDDFLHQNSIIKGAMNLIDADRAELLYDRMGPAVETSGGSAGNTAAGVASLGGKAAFFGKVADDHLGGIYRHDIRAQGVAFGHGQHDAELGLLGLALAFDDAAVVADDLGYQRQAQARALGFRGEKRIEQVFLDVFGDAFTVVLDADPERQMNA